LCCFGWILLIISGLGIVGGITDLFKNLIVGGEGTEENKEIAEFGRANLEIITLFKLA